MAYSPDWAKTHDAETLEVILAAQTESGDPKEMLQKMDKSQVANILQAL